MLTKEQFEILSIAAQADAPLSGAGTAAFEADSCAAAT